MIFKDKIRNQKYLKKLDSAKIFENTAETALPQTIVANIVKRHFSSKSGKAKRVLIYAFDGARADSMVYLIPSKNKDLSGSNLKSPFSAVTKLQKSGGLYLSFAGGERAKPETLQETSTAQGFAAILTGKWGIENGVVKHVTLKKETPTFLKAAAENGRKALFSSIWQDHFTITYKDEISEAKEKKLPLSFVKVNDEEELQKVMLGAIDDGTDLIFGINEFGDANGHGTGFGDNNCRYVVGITNADRYAFELFEHIESREEFKNEDWLYIVTSDHGGHAKGHGTQLEEDRITFIAVNKKI